MLGGLCTEDRQLQVRRGSTSTRRHIPPRILRNNSWTDCINLSTKCQHYVHQLKFFDRVTNSFNLHVVQQQVRACDPGQRCKDLFLVLFFFVSPDDYSENQPMLLNLLFRCFCRCPTFVDELNLGFSCHVFLVLTFVQREVAGWP